MRWKLKESWLVNPTFTEGLTQNNFHYLQIVSIAVNPATASVCVLTDQNNTCFGPSTIFCEDTENLGC